MKHVRFIMRIVGAVLLVVVVPSGGKLVAGAAPRRCDHRPVPSKCVPLRPCDSIWLVTTRHLPDQPCRDPNYRISCYQGGGWSTVNEARFRQSTGWTLVFVHGNRIEEHEAAPLGLQAYQHIISSQGHLPPIRLVVWSWPSDRVVGLVRDARQKAARTCCEGGYLASFLGRLDGHAPTSLMGFSYGARVITGAMHQLASRPQLARSAVRPRVVLAAAAVSRYAVHSSGAHCLSLTQMKNLTLINNRCDPVLRRYHLLKERRNDVAVGAVGIQRAGATPLRQYDFANVLGRSHSWERHMENAGIVATIRDGLFCHLPVDRATRAVQEMESSDSMPDSDLGRR